MYTYIDRYGKLVGVKYGIPEAVCGNGESMEHEDARTEIQVIL